MPAVWAGYKVLGSPKHAGHSPGRILLGMRLLSTMSDYTVGLVIVLFQEVLADRYL
mgnify:CR=1 FL=1